MLTGSPCFNFSTDPVAPFPHGMSVMGTKKLLSQGHYFINSRSSGFSPREMTARGGCRIFESRYVSLVKDSGPWKQVIGITTCFPARLAAWERSAVVRVLMEVAESDRILLKFEPFVSSVFAREPGPIKRRLPVDRTSLAWQLCLLIQVSYYLFWICARPRGTYMIVYLLFLLFVHRGNQGQMCTAEALSSVGRSRLLKR